jgi:hypothetical protein
MKAFNRFLKKHIQIILFIDLSFDLLVIILMWFLLKLQILKDTMKDREAALEFLYSCYAGIPSLFTDAVISIL